jgi:hypothetical protein
MAVLGQFGSNRERMAPMGSPNTNEELLHRLGSSVARYVSNRLQWGASPGNAAREQRLKDLLELPRSANELAY